MSRFGLPLLLREMTELAARRSTWIYRGIMAGLLILVALVVMVERGSFGSPLARLGTGRYLMEATVYTLFWGIYGLLPVLCCGAIADERERGTLDLLLITKLGPTTIIIEKVLSRLLPMLSLLMLSLPLLALSYTMGGFTTDVLIVAVWLLLVASIQVIAVTVMCSAFCRRSVAAFFLAWFIGLVIGFAPVFLDEFHIVGIRVEERLLVPVLFDRIVWQSGSLGDVVWYSLDSLAIAAVQLVLARWFLVRQTGTVERHPIGWFVQFVDWSLHRMLRRFGLAKGQFVSHRPLPEIDPILWRANYPKFIRCDRHRWYFIGAAIVVMPIVCLMMGQIPRSADEGMAVVYFIFIGVVAMASVVECATMFSSERSRQTLDILLSAPLTNRELLRQKFAGAMVQPKLLFVPYLLLLIGDGWIKASQPRQVWWSGNPLEFSLLLYLLSNAVTVAIYIPMLGWLATLIGLRVRRVIPAIVASLVAIGAWAVLPIMGIVLTCEMLGVRPNDGGAVFLLLSPFTFLLLNEVRELRELVLPPLVPLLLNSLIYGSALFLLRRRCYREIDRRLERADSPVDGS